MSHILEYNEIIEDLKKQFLQEFKSHIQQPQQYIKRNKIINIKSFIKKIKSSFLNLMFNNNKYYVIDYCTDSINNLLLLRNPKYIIIYYNDEYHKNIIDNIPKIEYLTNINNYNIKLTLQNNIIIYDNHHYKLNANNNNIYIYKNIDAIKQPVNKPAELTVKKQFDRQTFKIENSKIKTCITNILGYDPTVKQQPGVAGQQPPRQPGVAGQQPPRQPGVAGQPAAVTGQQQPAAVAGQQPPRQPGVAGQQPPRQPAAVAGRQQQPAVAGQQQPATVAGQQPPRQPAAVAGRQQQPAVAGQQQPATGQQPAAIAGQQQLSPIPASPSVPQASGPSGSSGSFGSSELFSTAPIAPMAPVARSRRQQPTQIDYLKEIKKLYSYYDNQDLGKLDEMILKKIYDFECPKINLHFENNSCYLDSVIVALFNSNNSTIIDIITKAPIKNYNNDGLNRRAEIIRSNLLSLHKNIFKDVTNFGANTCTTLRTEFKSYYDIYRSTVFGSRAEDIDWLSSQNDFSEFFNMLNIVFEIPENVKYSVNKRIENRIFFDINNDIDLFERDIKISDYYPRYTKEFTIETTNQTERQIIEYISAPLLLIQIKRQKDGAGKILTPVIPVEIIKLKNNNLYLNSIIIHFGQDNAGHYICLFECKGVWYEYNDMRGNSEIFGNGTFNEILSNDEYLSNIVGLLYYSLVHNP
jgi:hypothetical protein